MVAWLAAAQEAHTQSQQLQAALGRARLQRSQLCWHVVCEASIAIWAHTGHSRRQGCLRGACSRMVCEIEVLLAAGSSRKRWSVLCLLLPVYLL
jgi:hypothetical protein